MSILRGTLDAMRSAWNAVCTSAANLRREYIVEQYLRTGAQFGDALLSLYLGQCVDLKNELKRFGQIERRYASLGYRTLPLEDFIEYGAYGKTIHHLLRVHLEKGEAPVYHADLFERKYDEGFAPMSDFGGVDGEWLRCAFERKPKKGADNSGPETCTKEGCRFKDGKDGGEQGNK